MDHFRYSEVLNLPILDPLKFESIFFTSKFWYNDKTKYCGSTIISSSAYSLDCVHKNSKEI